MKVVFEKLTDDEREEFVAGFKSADDIGVDDWDCPTPWGAPWYWADSMESDSYSPEVWGREWFEQNRSDILGISPEDERVLLDAMGSQASSEDVKKFLDWSEENFVNVVELAKHGEENEFYEALEKCFGKGAE